MPRKKKLVDAEPEPSPQHPPLAEALPDLSALELSGVETGMTRAVFPDTLPLLPIRDQVYFPHMIFPLLVGREKSVRALEEAAAQQRHIFIVAQRNLHAEDPDPE